MARARSPRWLLLCVTLAASCRDGNDDGGSVDTATGANTSDASTSDPSGSSGMSDVLQPGLLVVTTPELRAVVDEFVRLIPASDIIVADAPDPVAAAAAAPTVAIAVQLGEDCVECYRLASDGPRFDVRAGDVLGAQYGLAHVLESLDVRFFAPYSTYVPVDWRDRAMDLVFADEMHAPEMAQRGVQLHTLHPIEAFYAFWIPSDEALEQARVISDWYIKQRANFVQWVGLSNIIDDPASRGPWREHTAAINTYLHDRGARSGLGIQLYGGANLQQALDLSGLDGPEVMAERFTAALDGTGFDHVALTFGEFSSSGSAESFIGDIDTAYSVLQDVAPGTTMSTTIHVGNYPDLLITYMGEEYLYYLLAQFADPNITPWIHTVMYYNLYQDAGGAYLHDEFTEHRELMLQRLNDGEDVGYHPETAYWVAFDNSVPTYLPLYMKSRHYDLAQTRARADNPLQRHIDFSSGFEWGYWQNDYAFCRMSFELPDDWSTLVTDMFAPFGDTGAGLADVVVQLGELQQDALIGQRLAAYLAGRDGLIDLGASGGVVAAPDRVGFDAFADMTMAERNAFTADVVAPLDELADGTEALLATAQGLTGADPWRAEIVDGIEVTALRTRFVAALYRAVIENAGGSGGGQSLADARATLDTATAVVARRHAALWSPIASTLVGEGPNVTVYPYGYLNMAHTLCYWNRELAQATNIVEGEMNVVPPCFDFTGS